LVNAISRSTVDSAARNAPFWNRYDVVGVMATGTILPIPVAATPTTHGWFGSMTAISFKNRGSRMNIRFSPLMPPPVTRVENAALASRYMTAWDWQ